MAYNGGGDGVSAEEWEQAMALLSTLINGKRRSDGANWAHAFDMMAGYLEVRLDQQPTAAAVHLLPPPILLSALLL